MNKHVSISASLLAAMMLQTASAAKSAMLNGQVMIDSRPNLGFEEDSEGLEDFKKTQTPEQWSEFVHSYDEEFIAERGQAANDFRLCVQLDQDWEGIETWTEQKYGSVGVHRLTTTKYDDWVAAANVGDKPWIIYFGKTPHHHSGDVLQAMDNSMRNLGCLAKLYGDQFNTGYMDHREAEMVYESYDFMPDMGKMTPVLAVFAHGKAYQAPWMCANAWKLTSFIENYATECQLCPQPIVKSRGDFSILVEYVKRSITTGEPWQDYFLPYINQELGDEHWFKKDIVDQYFSTANEGNKTIGRRVIKIAVITAIMLIYALYELICCLCCAKKPAPKNKKTEDKKDTTAKKSQREKIE